MGLAGAAMNLVTIACLLRSWCYSLSLWHCVQEQGQRQPREGRCTAGTKHCVNVARRKAPQRTGWGRKQADKQSSKKPVQVWSVVGCCSHFKQQFVRPLSKQDRLGR